MTAKREPLAVTASRAWASLLDAAGLTGVLESDAPRLLEESLERALGSGLSEVSERANLWKACGFAIDASIAAGEALRREFSGSNGLARTAYFSTCAVRSGLLEEAQRLTSEFQRKARALGFDDRWNLALFERTGPVPKRVEP